MTTTTMFFYTDEDNDALSVSLPAFEAVFLGSDTLYKHKTVGEVVAGIDPESIRSYEFATRDEHTGDMTSEWLDTFAAADDPRPVTMIEFIEKETGKQLYLSAINFE